MDGPVAGSQQVRRSSATHRQVDTAMIACAPVVPIALDPDADTLIECAHMPLYARRLESAFGHGSLRPSGTSIIKVVKTELLLELDVVGRPASFSTAAEAAWKAAVRAAISDAGGGPWTARFSVLIEFRTPEAKSANEVWDLDNLIKPTLDAMEGVFGLRKWKGQAQAADDRVDHLEASKRTVNM